MQFIFLFLVLISTSTAFSSQKCGAPLSDRKFCARNLFFFSQFNFDSKDCHATFAKTENATGYNIDYFSGSWMLSGNTLTLKNLQTNQTTVYELKFFPFNSGFSVSGTNFIDCKWF